MKNIAVLMTILALTSACATAKTAWKPEAGKTQVQMVEDSRTCLRLVIGIPLGKFGNGQEKAYNQCMYSYGHEIVEVD